MSLIFRVPYAVCVLIALCCAVTASAADGGEFEVPISYPDLQVDDPRVKIITSDADWDGINDPMIRVFLVKPGKYDREVTLTAGGFAGGPRWIRVYNTEGMVAPHPVRETEAARAVIRGLRIEGAYWIIDGLTVRGSGAFIRIAEDAHDVMLHRLLVEGGGGGAGQLNLSGSYNVVQQCVFRNTGRKAKGDYHGISTGGHIQQCRIVANEIYDCAGDCIQVHSPADGLLIADNDLYVTPALYSDGRGNLATDGAFAASENAIDLKASATDLGRMTADRILRVIGNRMWGFRRTDTAAGSTGSSGCAVVAHLRAQYILFENNIIFDSAGGIENANLATRNQSVINNLFYRLRGNAFGTLERLDWGEYYFNTLVECAVGFDVAERSRHDILGNVLIDVAEAWSGAAQMQPDCNAYYRCGGVQYTGAQDMVFDNPEKSENQPLRVTIKRLTGPTDMEIPHAATTGRSPHARLCEKVDIGARPNYGIHDGIFKRVSAGYVNDVTEIGETQ